MLFLKMDFHTILILFFFLICANVIYYYYIVEPYKILNEVYTRIITGYTLNDLYRLKSNISPEIEAVISVVEDLMDSKEMIDTSKKQAEYIALQNQINPHFLYNTLESIRSEAIIEGLDSVADITEILSSFYRYTISNIENSVSLQSEIDHIKAYFAIQKFRFGDKVNLQINQDTEFDVMSASIPKLILQPIVENAIYHGIERKVGPGTVTIDIIVTTEDLNITISDDGVGMSTSQLTALVHQLNRRSYNYLNDSTTDKIGIALVNVNTRLILLYGENYQLNVLSTENVGTDVEINIPLELKETHEETSR